MKREWILAAGLAMMVPSFAHAEDGAVVAAEKGHGTRAAAAAVKVSAEVTAIDAATRTVTLKGPKGNVFDVVADEKVRNFDQIKVGDHLRVTYAQAVALELKKGGQSLRSRTDKTDTARAAEGDKPAAAAAREVTVVADVVQVDKKKATVTLRGPERTVVLHVKDKSVLTKVKAGDQVEATFVTALALAIEPAPEAKK
ncbi:hypothetical protein [Niveibacterium sp. SC-1]|uniref:hypothetical protein n=1 Tax=Niveibacterium sp. SC-1 TaxID=3135646 RepID=UPI00311D7F12